MFSSCSFQESPQKTPTDKNAIAQTRLPLLQTTQSVMPPPSSTSIAVTQTLLTSTPTIDRNLKTVTSSPEMTGTQTGSPIPTASKESAVGLADLPDGEYLIYHSENSIGVLSIDGQIQRDILDISNFDVDISPDHKFIVMIPKSNGEYRYLVNLNTLERTPLTFLKDCYDVVPSIDGKYLVASCSFNNSFDIFHFSIDGKKIIQLTNCNDQKGSCGMPTYSPDGKWISYRWGPAGAIQSPKIGFYLLASDCISSSQMCQNSAIGPFNISFDYVWAPNNKYLVCSWGEMARLFEFTGRTIEKLGDIPGVETGFAQHDLAWSADSERLAYTRYKQINIIDTDGGNLINLKEFNQDVYILGWVRVEKGSINNN